MKISELNKEQREVVNQTEGSLLVLAGAGSGKTMAMTHRIAHIIEQGTDPYNILAVTFTNKAANEMKDRVEALSPNTRGIWIMTFHAMCLRMLRYSSDILGYRKGFSIYDESDKKSLLKRIIKDMDIDDKNYPVQMLVSIISGCKEREEDPDRYLELNAGDFKAERICQIYKAYNRELMNSNAMDFDDLLLNGVKLLEEDQKILEFYQKRFKYVMVDEYQDTNYLQYKLIKYLSGGHGNLCVVGDDDQCIYQWRGADIRNILDFEQDFSKVKTVRLEQNYRSDANILSLANSVIRNNRRRKRKKLWTDRSAGEKIIYKRCGDEKLEAWYIGGEIEKLRADGWNYGDMAILYRKNAQSRAFEEKFSLRGLPYRVLAGLRYYDRKEVKDVMAYMKLVDNPNDDVSMRRIINEPRRGVGVKGLQGITRYADLHGMSIFDALHIEEVLNALPKKTHRALDGLVKMIGELSEEAQNMNLSDLYDNLLRRSGYLKALEDADTVEADGRIENIMEFKSVIGEFEREGAEIIEDEVEETEIDREALRQEGFDVNEPTELGRFLERITLMSDIDNRNADEDAVVLMTMHSAKGLEFPIVFIPGMENGIFPGTAAFDDEGRLEEERRLCYVGITRAKKKLFLTSAKTRTLYGRTDYTTESIFLDEMDGKLFGEDKPGSERMKGYGGISGEGSLLGDYMYQGRAHGTADGYGGSPVKKPFDGLGYVKRQTGKAVRNEEFENGDRVIHPKFGEGMLIEQDSKTMIIIFDSVGRKKIGKGFVAMKKAEK